MMKHVHINFHINTRIKWVGVCSSLSGTEPSYILSWMNIVTNKFSYTCIYRYTHINIFVYVRSTSANNFVDIRANIESFHPVLYIFYINTWEGIYLHDKSLFQSKIVLTMVHRSLKLIQIQGVPKKGNDSKWLQLF